MAYVVDGARVAGAPVQLVYVPAESEQPEVTVEVAYDGLTQTWDPTSGDVDPGAPAPGTFTVTRTATLP